MERGQLYLASRDLKRPDLTTKAAPGRGETRADFGETFHLTVLLPHLWEEINLAGLM